MGRGYFWGCEARGPAGGEQLLVVVIKVPEAEVNDFRIEVLVQQDIRRLDISVGAADGLQVLYALDDLVEESLGSYLRQSKTVRKALNIVYLPNFSI